MSINGKQGSKDRMAPYWHTDPRLEAIVKAWPGLDEDAKTAIADMVK
ncbi:MAG: hypothetical protein MUC43_07940 [Pirellula sp.]|nr:hypothetical protein [Pirellula sp.]